ncbi:MAG: hypothetical protein ABI777_11970 [Betaproteobacteria bacterium]
MPSILIGQYDDFETADAVIADLRAAGVGAHSIERFHLNAAGQHDTSPIGGDEDADRNALEGDAGAISGATIGAVAGLAAGAVAMPVIGPFAAAAGLAVGAYAGSFAGAVSSMGDEDHPAPESEIPMRPAGVRVVVSIGNEHASATIERTLREHAVRSIERAEGGWRDGHWSVFDPVSTPHWILPPSASPVVE